MSDASSEELSSPPSLGEVGMLANSWESSDSDSTEDMVRTQRATVALDHHIDIILLTKHPALPISVLHSPLFPIHTAHPRPKSSHPSHPPSAKICCPQALLVDIGCVPGVCTEIVIVPPTKFIRDTYR